MELVNRGSACRNLLHRRVFRWFGAPESVTMLGLLARPTWAQKRGVLMVKRHSFVAWRRSLPAVAGLTAALVLIVGAAPALADTTVGATGSSWGTNWTCPATGEYGTTSYVIPASGVISSFSMSTIPENAGEQLDFQVLRPEDGTSYMVVGRTGAVRLAGTGGTETFSANIPTEAGDVLGVYMVTDVTNCLNDGGSVVTSLGGSDPVAGATIELSGDSGPYSMNESANLVTDSDLSLAQPSDVTVNATSPDGATVTYPTPAASDEDLSTVTVGCVPASGSVFAIGDTTVTCTATDTDGDTNSGVQKTFNVHVNSAAEQLTNLCAASKGVGPGTSLADKCAAAQAALAAGHPGDAKSILNAYINEVNAQRGKKIGDPAPADSLIAAAQQIIAVIGP